MEDDSTVEHDGISRRTALKRGAVVGGALVWTTPIVQTLAGPAFAQTEGSPGPDDDDEPCDGYFSSSANNLLDVRMGDVDIQLVSNLDCGSDLMGLRVDYDDANGERATFNLTLGLTECSGTPTSSPGSDFNVITLLAGSVGTVGVGNAKVDATVTGKFTDNSESGVPDRVELTIVVASNPALNLTVADQAVGSGKGNLQAHGNAKNCVNA